MVERSAGISSLARGPRETKAPPATTELEVPGVGGVVSLFNWPRRMAFVLFASTATAMNKAEYPYSMIGPSVFLETSRARRRRISIREARLIALEAVQRADQRRQFFAEREGKYFLVLFGDE